MLGNILNPAVVNSHLCESHVFPISLAFVFRKDRNSGMATPSKDRIKITVMLDPGPAEALKRDAGFQGISVGFIVRQWSRKAYPAPYPKRRAKR